MKRLILIGVLIFTLSGCYVTNGWNPSPTPGGYGVWKHDPAVDNGCNEWDVEPVAEVDNQGNLCPSYLP